MRIPTSESVESNNSGYNNYCNANNMIGINLSNQLSRQNLGQNNQNINIQKYLEEESRNRKRFSSSFNENCYFQNLSQNQGQNQDNFRNAFSFINKNTTNCNNNTNMPCQNLYKNSHSDVKSKSKLNKHTLSDTFNQFQNQRHQILGSTNNPEKNILNPDDVYNLFYKFRLFLEKIREQQL